MKDRINTRAVRDERNNRDQDDKPQSRSARQEPGSDPAGSRSSLKDLDSLDDEQLRKLTKANTKKNHGGRSSRIRSQVERVFRRLDNLAADVKLQPRYSIDALPVVSPDSSASHTREREVLSTIENNDQNTNDASQKENLKQLISQGDELETEAKGPADGVSPVLEQLLDALHVENNDFDIEPATQTSGFTDCTTSVSTTPGSVRSVRISTSVTVLDYIPLRPVSIAQLNRYEHPTRTGKCLQTRKLIAEGVDFPHFTIQRPDDVRGGANGNMNNNLRRTRNTVEGVTEMRERSSPPPPRRVHSTGSTTVECVVATPRGAYGSRVNKS